MANSPTTPGVAAARLPAEAYTQGFGDLYPPFDAHQAIVAADRCYFCHDAPCITACPTEIDIPLFIRQIQAGQPAAAGKTIFDQNIMGGMCARVCPTDELCEGACVREMAEGKPVEIGRLQRYATDAVMAEGRHPYTRAPETGFRVAVVGTGPAGLACAHRLAMRGHDVVILDARDRPGGLNEYGIAAYKTPDGFAQAEVDWLLGIGGITLRSGTALGRDMALEDLTAEYDAVFLGLGLAGVNALKLEGDDLANIEDAVHFIETLRQTDDKAQLSVGRDVVVIGGGMTAVDAAVQSKLLGAERVTMVYRRGVDRMSASTHEQDHAKTEGVRIVSGATPQRFEGQGGRVTAVSFTYTDGDSDEVLTIPADQVFRAIGQRLDGTPQALSVENGKITVTGPGRTTLSGVWAGGDCTAPGEDLTVTATAQGRDAADDIHAALTTTSRLAAE